MSLVLFLVVPQKAELGHFLAQLTEQVDHVFAVYAAREIKVEEILEIPALRRSGLDFCQVETERVEAAQQIVKRALYVRQEEAKTDFICVGRNEELF